MLLEVIKDGKTIACVDVDWELSAEFKRITGAVECKEQNKYLESTEGWYLKK